MENDLAGLQPGIMPFDITCIEQLRKTRKWTKFLSTLGFIFLAIMLIIILLVSARFLTGRYEPGLLFSIAPMALIAVIYFFPIYYLWQFSTYSKTAITHYDAGSLSAALRYLRLHYTFMGILVSIAVVFYIVAAAFMFGKYIRI